jgi:hypothetical protein
MATDWTHRLIIVVDAAEQAFADAVLHTMYPTDNPEGNPFGMQLTNDPNGELTHRGCNALATDDTLIAFEEALAQGDVPSLRYYRLDAATDTLVDTNSQPATEFIGESWNWPRMLADTGLAPMQHPLFESASDPE